MNAENSKRLIETYPKLYRQHALPMSETCMCWGFETGNGWFKLIDDLSRVLTELDKEFKTSTEAVQVKEKYGTLRFYIQGGTEVHEKAIDAAEEESAKTCEECGEPGELRRGGWLRTLCNTCYKRSKE